MTCSKPSFRINVVLILFVFVFMTACRKTRPATEDTSYATQHMVTEQTFSDVQNISDQAADIPSGSHLSYKTTATTISQCATVTHVNNIITIDFGPENCMCNDGRNRRGKIIVTYTGGHYEDSGSVHTITFNNFYQNDNKITGTKTVTNMGKNDSGQIYFNITIVGSVTLNGGGTISTNWNRVRTWIAGYGTLTYTPDDVYKITGSGKMTLTNGTEADITITAPLIVANNCHWIEAGTVSYTLKGATHTLDYGDIPACDDQATITLANGSVKSISLP